jgi:hypothetical protein
MRQLLIYIVSTACTFRVSGQLSLISLCCLQPNIEERIMADPKDSASKAAIPLELLKVEAAFVKRAVTSSSDKRSKGQGAPSYKRDVMYAASKHHLKDDFTHWEATAVDYYATSQVTR